jgi:ribosomal protein S12 methylthiotransferase
LIRLFNAEQLKIAVISLGCAKNRIDTEEILGLLGLHRFIITALPGDADVVIVNTCSFIESAQQESVTAILKAALPKGNRHPVVIAAGCLAELFGEELLQRIPELSGVIGVHSYKEIIPFLQRCLSGRRESLVLPPDGRYCSLGPRLLTAPGHSVYVKIAEGCNNHCRYCLIPGLRGPYRSRPPEEIVDEIKALVSTGTQEINLIAQDTTAYGIETGGTPDLPGLLQHILHAVPELPWLRVLYAYPSRISDRLIDLIAGEPQICKYLDLPLQHIQSTVLARMGRHYGNEEVTSLLERLRSGIPGLALRTTYMLGFPGETRQHFEELLAFMQRNPLERVGAFTYSPQKETEAAFLDHPVPWRVGEKRRRELMQVQKGITQVLNQKLIGRRLPVLVERSFSGGLRKQLFFGRTQYQAPEVDGGVFFKFTGALSPGQWVSVRITAASPYHLLGLNASLIQSPTS